MTGWLRRLTAAVRDTYDADEVRAVLAEVSPEQGGDPYCGRPSGGGERCGVCGSRQSCYPEPGGVFDRDQARAMLLDYWSDYADREYQDDVLDALAGCVRPAAIDRDALVAAIKTFPWAMSAEEAADRLITLALVRPVAGVTLTPEEAALARQAVRLWVNGMGVWVNGMPTPYPALLVLAARLEAAT